MQNTSSQTRRIVLVDGHSLIYRAFHALPPLTNDRGQHTGAAYGFFSMLLKALTDVAPAYCAVAFDLPGKTFRHERDENYKANRPVMPDDLRPQIPMAQTLLKAMGVPVVTCEGYEGDDVLGTLARRAEESGIDALIVTGDRDSFQLATDHIHILYTRRGISDTVEHTPESILADYGITPSQVPDMKGLMGDSSDNIPGIPGVGEKTAVKLLAQFGTLESVLDHAEEGLTGKLRERVIEHGAQAIASKDLATIKTDAPLGVMPEGLGLGNLAAARATFAEHGFKSLLPRLDALVKALGGRDATGAYAAASGGISAANASDVAAGGASDAGASGDAHGAANGGTSDTTASPRNIPDEATFANAPAELHNDAPSPAPIILTDIDQLLDYARSLEGHPLAVSISIDEIALAPTGCPSGNQAPFPPAVIQLGGDLLSPGLAAQDALGGLATILVADTPKLTHALKALRHTLAAHGITLHGPADDAMLAAYVLSPQRRSFSLGALLEAEGLPPDENPAQALTRLFAAQHARMEQDGLTRLYREVELPLADVLYEMEQIGFLVDSGELHRLGAGYQAQIESLQGEIHELAGEPVNINSPKQLSVLLFEKLGLPTAKKTRTGFSTDAEVLEGLSGEHPVVDKILAFRKVSKLNSTYIEGLLRLIGRDGRVRTSFDQVATATGRISSQEPNLQNIPVRTEMGREIRRAFVGPPGCVLVDADYSQIELRILAHMSGDEAMIDAFRRGQDIHRRTAAEVYGVPIDEVTPAMRSAAKAVNFGIVYGISDFGLARNTGISRGQAAEFIATYFARYPGVKRFMDTQVTLGKTQGYVTTLLGRRRYLPELTAGNHATRSFGERAAMNSPIQGTAADIIKMAMVNVSRALKAEGMASKLILQVHDELILECPAAEADAASALMIRAMEQVIALSVPIVAEVGQGVNWYDSK